MKDDHESNVSHSAVPAWLLWGVAAALGAMACNGAISDPGVSAPGVPMAGGAGSGGQAGGGGGAVVTDPGRISVHRLNNLEYDNTMRDLIGVDGTARATFQPDETGEFDNDADASKWNDARYEQYFDTAFKLGDAVFADVTPTGLRQTYVYGLVSPACAPAVGDASCTTKIVTAFAQKAWRRPLTATEVSGLVAVGTDAIKNQMVSADDSVKLVVQTILASPQFLYRIEFDRDPASPTAHALDSYELAARLSYLGWSSMPDKTLFDLAASNQLQTPAVLAAQIDRLLADPRGANFTESFAGQWLGAREVGAHAVEPTAFSTFDEPLRAALIQEELMYFNEFLKGPLPMTEFFTTPDNFVNTRLAKHYGLPPVAESAGFQKVTNADPNRVGFMGLGAFLTFTSFSYRTAPTLRGRWVLLNLLCQPPLKPPAGVLPLDMKPATDMSAQQQNVRAHLAQHRAQADCAMCHAILDPIGLGLENFDGIGAYRTKYAPTDANPIDASGMLPTGETFSSVSQLATLLSTGPRLQQLTDCASKKMMTYALSRSLTSTDGPYLNQIRTKWATEGYGLKALLKDIVVNDTFRFRRGEP